MSTLQEIAAERSLRIKRGEQLLKTAEETLESMIRCEASATAISIAERGRERAARHLALITSDDWEWP